MNDDIRVDVWFVGERAVARRDSVGPKELERTMVEAYRRCGVEVEPDTPVCERMAERRLADLLGQGRLKKVGRMRRY